MTDADKGISLMVAFYLIVIGLAGGLASWCLG